jgi:RNA polymerase sigma-70 factor (ECF subfamily)
MTGNPSDPVGRAAVPRTLGDVLYSDGSRIRVAENDWLTAIHSIAARDLDALRVVYGQTCRIVFTLSLRITGSRNVAEDVTADVFREIWRQADKYDANKETVVGWILNLTRECSLARLSNVRRQNQLTALQLRSARGMLTPDEQIAIEVAFFSRLPYADIAARLNQPASVVAFRIRRGLQKLRRMMDASPAQS